MLLNFFLKHRGPPGPRRSAHVTLGKNKVFASFSVCRFSSQACRGRKDDTGISRDSPGQSGVTPTLLPTESDILVAYSTTPGHVSFRHHHNGSWFIQALVKVLNEYAHREDLNTMMVRVNKEVGSFEHQEDSQTCKQTSSYVNQLRNKLFFCPA